MSARRKLVWYVASNCLVTTCDFRFASKHLIGTSYAGHTGMTVTELPFVTFIRIAGGHPPRRTALTLPDSERNRNHLNTVYTSAQFALAEAASGECLARQFEDLVKTNEWCIKRLKPAKVVA